MLETNEQPASLEQFLTSLSPEQLDILCSVNPYQAVGSLVKRAYESRDWDPAEPSMWQRFCPDGSFEEATVQDFYEDHKAELLARYLENFRGSTSPEEKTPAYMNEIIREAIEARGNNASTAEVPETVKPDSPIAKKEEVAEPKTEKAEVRATVFETWDDINNAWEKMEEQDAFQMFCVLAEISSRVDTSRVISGLSFEDFGSLINTLKSLRRESDPRSLDQAQASFAALQKLYGENAGKFNFNRAIPVIDECYSKGLEMPANKILQLCGAERLDSTGKTILIGDRENESKFEIVSTSGGGDRGEIIRVEQAGYKQGGRYRRKEKIVVRLF